MWACVSNWAFRPWVQIRCLGLKSQQGYLNPGSAWAAESKAWSIFLNRCDWPKGGNWQALFGAVACSSETARRRSCHLCLLQEVNTKLRSWPASQWNGRAPVKNTVWFLTRHYSTERNVPQAGQLFFFFFIGWIRTDCVAVNDHGCAYSCKRPSPFGTVERFEKQMWTTLFE